jgi:hypothetical protein
MEDKLMKEEWKDIPGFEVGYMVSNMGRVKSKDRHVEQFNYHANKNVLALYKGKLREPFTTKNGYKSIRLWNNQRTEIFLVHRLVASLFISNPLNKPNVNHIDGNRSNNKVDNLEWCTHSENMIHAHRVLGKVIHNKGQKPEESHMAKPVVATEKDGTELHFPCIRNAAEYYGVDKSGVTKVCKGKQKTIRGVSFRYFNPIPPHKVYVVKHSRFLPSSNLVAAQIGNK